jgi:(p)ppGpp synthase/HD superfamily hydrolase
VSRGPVKHDAADDDELVADLLQAVRAGRPDADIPLVVRAYLAAESWHRGQLRKSGDPYITHPVAVAVILAGMDADDATLCAALLHDVLDDTRCRKAVLQAEFGHEIADLVEQVSAMSAAGDQLSAVAIAGLAADPAADNRALLIKIADRLHNMRTVGYLPAPKQVNKSMQTLQVQVPVARALGVDVIGAELAELASATLRRHHQAPPTASGRMLCVSAVLLPASVRSRWREEWLAELQMLPSRRARAVFAGQIVLGIGRLAVTLHWRND